MRLSVLISGVPPTAYDSRTRRAALRTEFHHATCDVTVVQDADLEYNPSEYPKLLQPILKGRADVVYDSRFLSSAVAIVWGYVIVIFFSRQPILGGDFMEFYTFGAIARAVAGPCTT